MSEVDISSANILSERGIRYKRNTLAANLVATVLYWTDAPLGEISLFGVSLTNVKDKEAAAWVIFLAILGYQWIMLAYYGRRDWRIWHELITETFKLSPWNIAFWIKKGAAVWDSGEPSEFMVSHIATFTGRIQWRAKFGDATQTHLLRDRDREHIRWRLIAFLTIEFGLPFLWGIVCLGLAMLKISN